MNKQREGCELNELFEEVPNSLAFIYFILISFPILQLAICALLTLLIMYQHVRAKCPLLIFDKQKPRPLCSKAMCYRNINLMSLLLYFHFANYQTFVPFEDERNMRY